MRNAIFTNSVPLAIAASLVFFGNFDVSMPGVVLAMGSGALASGLRYAVWYAALQGLTASRPAIRSRYRIGRWRFFLSEPISLRLGIATLLTIGEIWLVLAQRTQKNKS